MKTELEELKEKYNALNKEVDELKKVISEWEQFCKAANESIFEKVEYIDELIKEVNQLKGQTVNRLRTT